ncbi:posphoenolpyruvate synthetase regulatory kinase/phosphorylase PpsR [Kaarinaea lacus]
MKRAAFFLSDKTGITAEMVGQSLLTQFESVEFDKTNLPYIDSVEKAEEAVKQINEAARQYGNKPFLFSTLIDKEVREIIKKSEGKLYDLFDTYTPLMEEELGIKSTQVAGKTHGIGIYSIYKSRIDALNFSLTNDDGTTLRNFPEADIILIGVSRSGKTPTCLYLALQFGINAANYPLIDGDLRSTHLPKALEPYRNKLFGLTIAPERLQQIRQERRPDSNYSNYEQCEQEVSAVERIYRNEQIPYLDTSAVSIEEIATTILETSKLKSRLRP